MGSPGHDNHDDGDDRNHSEDHGQHEDRQRSDEEAGPNDWTLVSEFLAGGFHIIPVAPGGRARLARLLDTRIWEYVARRCHSCGQDLRLAPGDLPPIDHRYPTNATCWLCGAQYTVFVCGRDGCCTTCLVPSGDPAPRRCPICQGTWS